LIPEVFTNVTGGQYVGVNPTSNNSIQILSGLGQLSSISAGPFYFQGGLVYVIDKVLQVPLDIPTTTAELNLNSTQGAFNLTGLANSLGSALDVTIFAPANAAFEAIGSAMSNISSTDLSRLMQYHVLSKDVVYSSAFGNKQYKTLQGNNITMSVRSDGSVYVNNARVIQKDILIENGILHIIDNVMNPNNMTVAPTSATSGSVAFARASDIGQLPFSYEPLSTATGTANPTPLNTTAPSSSPSSTPNSSLSGGATAGIVIGVLIAIGIIGGAIYFFVRRKGYQVKVSRRSIIISHPNERYELPEEGGHTDKVELPASEKHTETSSSPEPPDYPEDKKEKPSKKDPSPISPMTPHDGIWELSAEHDVRQRIEALLRPKDKI
jgi:uncharacterized surface protein with fasciclin (FAS1) repeats